MPTRPWFETPEGRRVELEWRRLRPECEVDIRVPSPPREHAPRQAGEGWGRQSRGAGFDRIEVDVSALWVASDELVGSRAENVTPSWRADQVAELEGAAARILAAFDHPADHLDRRLAWAWVGEDLMWAEAPERSGFVVGLQRPWFTTLTAPDADRVLRAGSWAAAAAAPAFRGLWPPFGALDWARHVYEGARLLRYAHDQGEGSNEDRRPQLVEAAWAAGFRLSAFLTEHRIRSLHAELLTRGEKNRRDVGKGAGVTNALKADVTADRRREVRVLAESLQQEPPPKGRQKWSRAALAGEIVGRWKTEPVPAITTIEADLKALNLP